MRQRLEGRRPRRLAATRDINHIETFVPAAGSPPARRGGAPPIEFHVTLLEGHRPRCPCRNPRHNVLLICRAVARSNSAACYAPSILMPHAAIATDESVSSVVTVNVSSNRATGRIVRLPVTNSSPRARCKASFEMPSIRTIPSGEGERISLADVVMASPAAKLAMPGMPRDLGCKVTSQSHI